MTSIAICWLLPKVIRILFQLVGLPGDYRPKRKIGAVFSKKLSFLTINLPKWEFTLSGLSMASHMQEGLLLYELFDMRIQRGRSPCRGEKMMKILKFFRFFNIDLESF